MKQSQTRSRLSGSTNQFMHLFVVFVLSDYQGLTRSFHHGKIYCSLITARLVNMKIGIPWDRLQVLPLNQKTTIAGIDVTCLEANHCPGSIIILFEPQNGKVWSTLTSKILHCYLSDNSISGSDSEENHLFRLFCILEIFVLVRKRRACLFCRHVPFTLWSLIPLTAILWYVNVNNFGH